MAGLDLGMVCRDHHARRLIPRGHACTRLIILKRRTPCHLTQALCTGTQKTRCAEKKQRAHLFRTTLAYCIPSKKAKNNCNLSFKTPRRSSNGAKAACTAAARCTHDRIPHPAPPVHPESTTPTHRPRQTEVIRASALPDTVAHRPTPSSSGPGRPGSLRYATIARGGFDPKVICR